MCGILGVVAKTAVNQLLYDGLLLLQHRGQDAAGIVTSEHKAFHMHKGPGMVRDVFRTRNMRSLSGGTGIGHCRYPTAGSAFNAGEAQPFYVNSPFGIVLGHNGNLTNSEALKQEMFRQDLRHINTNSDSEVLLNVLAHELELDVLPGEAIFIDEGGTFNSRQCAAKPVLAPCIFEYVYLARPDSVMDAVSVYESRLHMGRKLSEKIKRTMPHLEIDVVIPVPDTSRPAALELAHGLNVTYREGFIRNRYIGRTFIMPGQTIRKKSVRQKLSVVGLEFKDKNVLIVDDSIVRGTTGREIVQMAREAGASKVFFASAAPPVRFPNVYGIDMPTRAELIATGRNEGQVAREIGADAVIYQDLDALKDAVRALNPKLTQFETSCFDGVYITGDVTSEYLASIERQRDAGRQESVEDAEDNQLDLNAA